MPKRSRRVEAEEDEVQIAARIVATVTGDITVAKKDPAAVALGRKGGLKGGRVRAARMSPEERRESASKAAIARWKRRTI